MKILEWIWLAIQALIGYNLGFPVFLLLLFGLRKGLGSVRSAVSQVTLPDYGIIVTAYEYTAQLPAVVGSLLELNYEHYQGH